MMDAVWLSMLLSASAGMLAVSVVVATFYFIRWASQAADWSRPQACAWVPLRWPHHFLPGAAFMSQDRARMCPRPCHASSRLRCLAAGGSAYAPCRGGRATRSCAGGRRA